MDEDSFFNGTHYAVNYRNTFLSKDSKWLHFCSRAEIVMKFADDCRILPDETKKVVLKQIFNIKNQQYFKEEEINYILSIPNYNVNAQCVVKEISIPKFEITKPTYHCHQKFSYYSFGCAGVL